MTPEDNRDRQVIPRWRRFSVSVALKELSSGKTRRKKLGPQAAARIDADWNAKLQDWKRSPSFATASTLLEAAAVNGKTTDISDAVEFVLGRKERMPPGVISIARSISARQSDMARIDSGRSGEVQSDPPPDKMITILRGRIRLSPRNAIAYVDLALAYCLLGNMSQARKAISIAYKLAPENRFVLRAFARFLVHQNSFDEAHSIMMRSSAAKSDPWLAATEVALASLAKKPSRLAKLGQGMLDDENFRPYDLAELGAAIGTLELDAGSHKRSRKILRQTLAHPNDNSLAQVAWLDRFKGTALIDQSSAIIRNTPRSYEAQTSRSFTLGDWVAARDASLAWAADESFSAIPYYYASYAESSFLHDYESAVMHARRGLKINPRSDLLINSLALSLARAGKPEEAATVLDGAIDDDDVDIVTHTATRGLIAFRRNDIEQGERLYLEAITKAVTVKVQPWLALRAWFYYAFERSTATPIFAKEILEITEKWLKKAKARGVPNHVESELTSITADIARIVRTQAMIEANRKTLPNYLQVPLSLIPDHKS